MKESSDPKRWLEPDSDIPEELRACMQSARLDDRRDRVDRFALRLSAVTAIPSASPMTADPTPLTGLAPKGVSVFTKFVNSWMTVGTALTLSTGTAVLVSKKAEITSSSRSNHEEIGQARSKRDASPETIKSPAFRAGMRSDVQHSTAPREVQRESSKREFNSANVPDEGPQVHVSIHIQDAPTQSEVSHSGAAARKHSVDSQAISVQGENHTVHRDVASLPEGNSRTGITRVDTISIEAQMLEQTRAHLDTEPSAALRLLRRHDAQFPMSVLSEEREILWIRLKLGMGDTRDAYTRAIRFRSLHPQSAHLLWIDEILRRSSLSRAQ